MWVHAWALHLIQIGGRLFNIHFQSFGEKLLSVFFPYLSIDLFSINIFAKVSHRSSFLSSLAKERGSFSLSSVLLSMRSSPKVCYMPPPLHKSAIAWCVHSGWCCLAHFWCWLVDVVEIEKASWWLIYYSRPFPLDCIYTSLLSLLWDSWVLEWVSDWNGDWLNHKSYAY